MEGENGCLTPFRTPVLKNEGKMERSGLLIKKTLIIEKKPDADLKGKITPSLPLNLSEIRQKYKGFDGNVWPYPYKEIFEKEGISIQEETGLVDLKQYSELKEVYSKLPPNHQCSLLFISYEIHSTFVGTALENDFVFLGYDCGNYICEYNHFSLIWHEILFGQYEKLRRYAPRLNESLLFPDLSFWEDYRADRQSLVQQGADLEDELPGEFYEPIQIWGLTK